MHAFTFADLPFRMYLEQNRHFGYYMILACNISVWLFAVMMRRSMKHIPVLLGVLFVNSLLMTQAYTQGGQSAELGEPKGGPMH